MSIKLTIYSSANNNKFSTASWKRLKNQNASYNETDSFAFQTIYEPVPSAGNGVF